jgi:hypothetical protein
LVLSKAEVSRKEHLEKLKIKEEHQEPGKSLHITEKSDMHIKDA